MENKNKNDKGTAAVEFALVLPILLFVLFAIIELSIAMYDKAVITNASREGARMGILMALDPRPDAAAIAAVVSSYTAANLISFSPAAPSTTVTGAPCAPAPATGGYITVSVAYTYNFFVLPNFMKSLTGPLVLNGAAVMRCE